MERLLKETGEGTERRGGKTGRAQGTASRGKPIHRQDATAKTNETQDGGRRTTSEQQKKRKQATATKHHDTAKRRKEKKRRATGKESHVDRRDAEEKSDG